uniref:Uncharacterized protein n=1 Tax=Aegilops tauschii subsp. strangulata TaxID=200361 RepID=A0A453BM57_AEGTS
MKLLSLPNAFEEHQLFSVHILIAFQCINFPDHKSNFLCVPMFFL